MIIILHDACDILCHVCKAFNVSTFNAFAPIPFVLCQLAWIWFRLFSLPMIIWSLHHDSFYPNEQAQFDPYMTINMVFLSTLLAMHLIWFMMFQRINYSILTKKAD